MYLFQSWKESLLFFKPKNFKLFALVTIKSIIETLKVWLKYFWWVLALFIVSDIISHFQFVFLPMFRFLSTLLLLFTLVLSARSSVKRKTLEYFWGYKFYFLLTILCFLVLSPLVLLYGLGVVYIFPTYGSYTLLFDSFFRAFFLQLPLVLLSILFLLDSRGKCGDAFLSVFRAFKMVAFNYPFCVCMFFILDFCLGGIFAINGTLGLQFMNSQFRLLFFIIHVCVFTNFYIKRSHDQYKLYFVE